METKLIVKYRRPNDCWICPDCDAENDIGSTRCTVCSCAKNPAVSVLRAWSPELERVKSTSAAKKPASYPSHPSTGGSSSASGYGSYDTEENNSNVFWIVAGIVALFFILVALS